MRDNNPDMFCWLSPQDCPDGKSIPEIKFPRSKFCWQGRDCGVTKTQRKQRTTQILSDEQFAGSNHTKKETWELPVCPPSHSVDTYIAGMSIAFWYKYLDGNGNAYHHGILTTATEDSLGFKIYDASGRTKASGVNQCQRPEPPPGLGHPLFAGDGRRQGAGAVEACNTGGIVCLPVKSLCVA